MKVQARLVVQGWLAPLSSLLIIYRIAHLGVFLDIHQHGSVFYLTSGSVDVDIKN